MSPGRKILRQGGAIALSALLLFLLSSLVDR